MKKGLALGNQSSQWFVLYYLDRIDRLVKEKLRINGYVRYMDDFILIHRDKRYLQYCLEEINKIIFTDGDANMPNTPIDAIWIVFGGIKINPAGGKVIHIDDEQLERLYNYQITNEAKGRSR